MAHHTIHRFLASFVLVMLLLPGRATAESMTFNAVADNTLFENADGDLSNGAGDYLFVGRTLQFSDSLRRTVLRFDVSALPSGAVVHTARLTLRVTMTISGNQNVSLHRVLTAWTEGSSNATGQEGGGIFTDPGDTTWLHTESPGSFWTTPGGDFHPTASAVRAVGADHQSYGWESTAMAADVQGWLDAPASNFGWLLVGNEIVAGSAKRFNSRENAAFAPVLQVDYYLPSIMAGSVNAGAGPITDVLLIDGSAGGPDRRVEVPTSTGFTVDFIAPPQGEGNGRFALWVWIGLPCNPALLSHQSEDIGTVVNATPLTGGSPQPFRCVASDALPSAVCRNVRTVNGPQTYPFSLPSSGLGNPLTLTLQALCRDQGAGNSFGYSISNAVILDIVP